MTLTGQRPNIVVVHFHVSLTYIFLIIPLFQFNFLSRMENGKNTQEKQDFCDEVESKEGTAVSFCLSHERNLKVTEEILKENQTNCPLKSHGLIISI